MDNYNLDKKETEVVNLSASISAGCIPCTKYHIKKCKESGMTDIEIESIINKIEKLCNRATSVMTNKAYQGDLKIADESFMGNKNIDNNIETIIGITVSYIMNNTFLFEIYSSQSGIIDAAPQKISEIIEISKPIAVKARIHMELLTEEKNVSGPSPSRNDCSPGCNC